MTETLVQESILLIDNDFNTLKLLSTYFIGEGFNVRIAKSTTKANQSIEKELPDLIIIDCDAPTIGGHRFCQQLGNHYRTKDIPIIFTGYQDDPESVLKAYEAGAVDFLRKPLRIEKLIARITIQMKLVRQLKELREFNRIMMDREDRIIELKQEVNQLANELGRTQPYSECKISEQPETDL